MWKSIVAPLALVWGIWLASSLMTTRIIGEVEESHQVSIADHVATMESVSAMQGIIWRIHSLVLSDDDRLTEVSKQKINSLSAEFRRYLDATIPTCITEPEKESVARLAELFSGYQAELAEVMAKDALTRPIDEEMRQLAREITAECRSLHDINKQLLDASTRDRIETVRYLNLARHGTVAIGPLIGAAFGFWISRRFHRSVAEISVSLGDVVGKLEHDVGRVVIKPLASLPSLQRQVQAVAVRIQRVVDELQQARKQVLAAERLAVAGELAAGVAHEIRNPLTSVKLLIQMAAQRGPGHSLDEEQLGVLQREIVRIERIVQGLLDFAKPPRLRRIRHDLRDTARQALNLVSGRARQQRVALVDEFASTPVYVDADPDQLQQVLVNLLLNGIEAMPNGGKMQVSVASEPGPPARCRVVVCDSGPGIAPDVLDKIFDPFVTTKKGGTGLGLAVSRRIIEEHDGSLEATNQASGGARLETWLPLADTIPGLPAVEDEDSHAKAASDRR